MQEQFSNGLGLTDRDIDNEDDIPTWALATAVAIALGTMYTTIYMILRICIALGWHA